MKSKSYFIMFILTILNLFLSVIERKSLFSLLFLIFTRNFVYVTVFKDISNCLILFGNKCCFGTCFDFFFIFNILVIWDWLPTIFGREWTFHCISKFFLSSWHFESVGFSITGRLAWNFSDVILLIIIGSWLFFSCKIEYLVCSNSVEFPVYWLAR